MKKMHITEQYYNPRKITSLNNAENYEEYTSQNTGKI